MTEPDYQQYLLKLNGINKQYPGCLASDNIDLQIETGSITAILGENGAGKSTLMKIIYGAVKPDSGELYWQGQRLESHSPGQARRLGIGMVFQHFSLFETLTVVENIALGIGAQQVGSMDALAEKITQTSRRYGMTIEPHRHVHSLSMGERQRVEILRCLVQDVKLLILDEPTSVLTPQEVEQLFEMLRQLATEGTSILFISHKLKEVQTLCDRAVVLRNGRVSGSCNPALESVTSMAKMMVGDDTPMGGNYKKAHCDKPFLRVESLNLSATEPFGISLKNISFNVNAGEIMGIAGIAGNGQSELLNALSGEAPLGRAGVIYFEDVDLSAMSPRGRRAKGLGFVPEDRLGRGAVPDMSLWENGLLTSFMQSFISLGMLKKAKIKQHADQLIANYGVKCAGNHAPAKSLSGGNLQKFIIGREIQQNPLCLVAAHPTWGVDIGAASAIYDALIALRDRGAAILVISEDTDELFTICDRVGALFHGQLSPVKPIQDTSIDEVGKWMAGVFEPVAQHGMSR